MATKIEIIIDAGKYAVRELAENTTKQATKKKGAAVIGEMLGSSKKAIHSNFSSAPRVSRFTRELTEDIGKRMGLAEGFNASQQKTIASYLHDTWLAHAKTKPSKLDKLFSNEKSWWLHTKEFNRARSCAQKLFPQIKGVSSLIQKQLASFVKKLEPGQTIPKGYKTVQVYEIVDGKRHQVTYAFDREMFENFTRFETRRIARNQDDMTELLLEAAKENIQTRGLNKEIQRIDFKW